MGGKSRKTGQMSKKLIDLLKKSPVKIEKDKDTEKKSGGLFDDKR